MYNVIVVTVFLIMCYLTTLSLEVLHSDFVINYDNFIFQHFVPSDAFYI